MFFYDIQCLIPDGRPTLQRSNPISLRSIPKAHRSIYRSLWKIKMVQALDQCSPSGSAGTGWVSCGLHESCGLLKPMLVTNVAQALQEAYVSRAVDRAEAP